MIAIIPGMISEKTGTVVRLDDLVRYPEGVPVKSGQAPPQDVVVALRTHASHRA